MENQKSRKQREIKDEHLEKELIMIVKMKNQVKKIGLIELVMKILKMKMRKIKYCQIID